MHGGMCASQYIAKADCQTDLKLHTIIKFSYMKSDSPAPRHHWPVTRQQQLGLCTALVTAAHKSPATVLASESVAVAASIKAAAATRLSNELCYPQRIQPWHMSTG
eukprot:7757-Heterococcus_DN1.PRE.2